MKISNLSDAQFTILVIRMLKELIGCCNSVQKTHAEIKVALSEIKKNLQGTTVEWMKTQIKSMTWNISKNHSIGTARRKKNKRKKQG